jgi:hypothetical protein
MDVFAFNIPRDTTQHRELGLQLALCLTVVQAVVNNFCVI